MTSANIQNHRSRVSSFEHVTNELATIRNLLAGTEAELRRAHLEISLLKSGRPNADTPSGDLLSRVEALEAKKPSRDTSDEALNLVRALADEIATINARRLEDAARLAELERTVGAIGQQFMTLAAKAA